MHQTNNSNICGIQNFCQPSKFNVVSRARPQRPLGPVCSAIRMILSKRDESFLLIPSSVSNTFKIVCNWLQFMPYLRQLHMAVPHFHVALIYCPKLIFFFSHKIPHCGCLKTKLSLST